MRIRSGARWINSQGGALYIHSDGVKPVSRFSLADQSPIAPIEIRDALYTRLIKLSPAALFPHALITGERGLRARGMDERHFGNFGGLPGEWRERERLTRQIVRDTNVPFPGGESALGTPGFWMDQDGPHLWKKQDIILPSLIIPVRNPEGRIQACQIRSSIATASGSRYFWLSSSDLPKGASPGSPLHFKCRIDDQPHDACILIVEGILKADILFAFRPDLPIVATPCVNANHARLVDLLRGRPVIIAFDQDYVSNETVCFHLASLISKRIRRERSIATTRIASWDARFKGIDDAAVQNCPLSSISVTAWFHRLSPYFQRIVTQQFSRIPNISRILKNDG